MSPIIVDNVKKIINDVVIIQSANLCIDKGEICALIGPNGVGKTTLIKCLLGLAFPDEGTIKLNNKILKETTMAEILSNIGAILQYPSSISHLTIKQLFIEHFHYLNIERIELLDEILKTVELNISPDTKIGNMSLGMKQRLLIAVALSHKPNILILDEPFNSLDIDGINIIKNILKIWKNNNASILITSHSLLELEDIATNIVFMKNGRTYDKKNVEDIKKEYKGGLQEYYQQLKMR